MHTEKISTKAEITVPMMIGKNNLHKRDAIVYIIAYKKQNSVLLT